MAKELQSDKELQQYHRAGYLIIRNYFSRDEINRLYEVAIEDAAVSKNAINVNDSSGRRIGTSRQTVTALFSDFRDAGLCIYSRRQSIFSNLQKLAGWNLN